MTTLISGGKSGEERRCDAKCYDARHPECDCICGGKNHGVGLARAQENTRDMAETLLRMHGDEVTLFPQEIPLFREPAGKQGRG